MRILFYFFLIIITFSSCQSYVFTKIQNVNGTELKEFPDILIGDWTGKIDSTWTGQIESNGLLVTSFSKENITIDDIVFSIGDSLKLFQLNEFLILNKISKVYSSKEKSFYEVYVLLTEKDSINMKTNIYVHSIKDQHLSVSYAKKYHQGKKINPANMGYFGVASEGRAINYDLKASDIKELYHIQPLFVLTDGEIIPGQFTDIGYECGPLPWKIRRKEKRIKRLMKN